MLERRDNVGLPNHIRKGLRAILCVERLHAHLPAGSREPPVYGRKTSLGGTLKTHFFETAHNLTQNHGVGPELLVGCGASLAFGL